MKQFGIAFAVLVAACEGSVGKDDRSSEPAGSTHQVSDEAVVSDLIVGEWISPECQSSGEFSNKTVLEITKTNLSAWDITYSDEACSAEVVRKRMNAYVVELGIPGEWKQTTYEDNRILVTVLKSNALKVANESSFCEISDWESGKPRNVVGKFCSWDFGGSTLEWGTLLEEGHTPQTTFGYYQIVENLLCWSREKFKKLPPLSTCWQRVR